MRFPTWQQARQHVRRIVLRTLLGAAVLVLILVTIAIALWNKRQAIDEIPLPHVTSGADFGDSAVAVTWFGVSTLLFDDGETQLLIDAYISRPSLLQVVSRQSLESDAATINRFLNAYDVTRLAAIIPVHSHFDHALDIGALANRTSASILGSETTANIARGQDVVEDQIVVIAPQTDYTFGAFTVRFLTSLHAPIGWRGTIPFAGTLSEPLSYPAPASDYVHGGSYSIVIEHSSGTALIQGSAGYADGALDSVAADTVFLSVGMLEGLGDNYTNAYWTNTVTSTGARHVVPVHFDDYTAEFGTVRLAPSVLDDFSLTVARLQAQRDHWDIDTVISLPLFGVPFDPFLPSAEPVPELAE